MNKRQLITALARRLHQRKYSRLADPIGAGATAVFYKRLPPLVLELGIEVSKMHEEHFTGSFYLSESFHWAYMLPGFPVDALRRVGELLSLDERKKLLETNFHNVNVVDAWWTGFSEANCDMFIKAHDTTVERFLAQPELRETIINCPEMRHHVEMANHTRTAVARLRVAPDRLKFQPITLKAGIDSSWYWAAEVTLREQEPDLISRRYVELLAIDAWRMYNL